MGQGTIRVQLLTAELSTHAWQCTQRLGRAPRCLSVFGRCWAGSHTTAAELLLQLSGGCLRLCAMCAWGTVVTVADVIAAAT